MASTDTLFDWEAPGGITYPSANYGSPSVRVGTNTTVPTIDFDDTTDETIFLRGHVPDNYSGGGFTVTIKYMMASATSGTVSLDVSFMSITDDADDLDTKSFATANNGNFTVPSAAGEVGYETITFTDGADSDSVAANEDFYLKFTRDADSTTSTDDAAGDLQLISITITET